MFITRPRVGDLINGDAGIARFHQDLRRTWPLTAVGRRFRILIDELFADFFREQGVLVHFTDGQSPWQNGPTERAGGAFKEMLDEVILDATA